MPNLPITDNSYCESCRHFRAFINDPDGECRRYPPVYTPINQGDGAWIPRFPTVLDSMWCGEWAPKDGEGDAHA